jgi:predicted DNA binding CopG/RHH family protein
MAPANDTKEWRKQATRRTTAIYFRSSEDMEKVRAAAEAAGVPFTVFIREAALRAARKAA